MTTMYVEPIHLVRRICDNQSCQEATDKLGGVERYTHCVSCLNKYATNCSDDLRKWKEHLVAIGANYFSDK